MKTIKKKYKIQQFTITSENIDKFEIMENRRQIGDGQVKMISGVLTKGENPLGELIVNEINGKWRLIDGNHRLEALKRFYSKKGNKDISIECTIRLYKDLSNDEEREIYSNEAKRRNESHEDRLNLYKDTIIFWKLTQDELNKFPCKVTIYPSVNGLRFRTILDSLATIKSEMKNGYCPRYLGKEDLIEFARELSFEDFLLIKNFVKIFQNVFGVVDKKNVMCRRQGFLPTFDIYVKNFHNKKDSDVENRFKLVLGKSDLLMYLNMQGREAQQKIREIMIGYMNKGKRIGKNLVV